MSAITVASESIVRGLLLEGVLALLLRFSFGARLPTSVSISTARGLTPLYRVKFFKL